MPSRLRSSANLDPKLIVFVILALTLHRKAVEEQSKPHPEDIAHALYLCREISFRSSSRRHEPQVPPMTKPPPSDPQLLVAAARAVLAIFQEQLDKQQISGPAAAALRLLEAALEPYP
jgi:hypothetical protein